MQTVLLLIASFFIIVVGFIVSLFTVPLWASAIDAFAYATPLAFMLLSIVILIVLAVIHHRRKTKTTEVTFKLWIPFTICAIAVFICTAVKYDFWPRYHDGYTYNNGKVYDCLGLTVFSYTNRCYMARLDKTGEIVFVDDYTYTSKLEEDEYRYYTYIDGYEYYSDIRYRETRKYRIYDTYGDVIDYFELTDTCYHLSEKQYGYDGPKSEADLYYNPDTGKIGKHQTDVQLDRYEFRDVALERIDATYLGW